MPPNSKYLIRKDLIRSELFRRARAGEFPTYAEFGTPIGISAQGPWKIVLDDISREETANGRPDITFILKNKKTQYPGQINFESASEGPGARQVAVARTKIQEVIDAYCPGTNNPY